MCLLMTIRFAEPQDVEQIMELCAAHAQYEKHTFDKKGKAASLFNYLFYYKDVVHCLVVVDNDRLVGYATFMKQFSTWESTFYLYLDCLFLEQCVRGKGMGQKIMEQVKRFAEREDCSWIEWQTPSFNTSAIRFYEKMGAYSKTKERFYWK